MSARTSTASAIRQAKLDYAKPLNWPVSRLEKLLGQARNVLVDLADNEDLTADGHENIRALERGLTELYDEFRTGVTS